MNIEKSANAIETDAGQPLPELRQVLREPAAHRGRVTSAEQLLVRAARSALGGLSQADFAVRIDTPVATLRDGEQGRFAPPGAALHLMHLLVAHPKPTNEWVVA